MNKPRRHPQSAPTLSNRVRLLLVLLCVGIAGILLVFYFRHLSHIAAQHVVEVATYANRGVITNVTEIFQIPALMFFGVLVAYALHELFKVYQAMNDPETYRNKIDKSTVAVGKVAGRKAKRAAESRPKNKPSGRSVSASQARNERKRQTKLSTSRLPHIKDETELPRMTDVTKIPTVTGVKEKD